MIQTNRRRGTRLVRCLLAVGVVLGALMLPPSRPEARAVFSGVRLLSSTPEAAVVEFVLPALSLTQVDAGDWSYWEVRAGELPLCGEPGAPQLPCTGVLLGLPPSGEATAQIVEQEVVRQSLSAPVYPVPVPEPARGKERPGPVSYQVAPDPAIYGAEGLYPASVVELGTPGWVRSQRVARLAIRPVRYDPRRQELVVVRRLVIEVRFETAAVSAADSGRGDSPAFDALLDEALLNADVASSWRADLAADGVVRSASGPAGLAGSYKIFVEQDGFYRLTYADLHAAGLAVQTLDPRTLQLFEGERELAIQVTGQQDGSFDASDVLLFYGRARQSRYGTRNVYWLRAGGSVGLRMASRSLAAAQQPAGVLWTTARWEQNQFYDNLIVAADGDHWYAADLQLGQQEQVSVPLMAPAPGLTDKLRVYLAGYTHSPYVKPDHHVVVQVNGQSAGSVRWDGKGAVAHEFSIPAEWLRPGDNDLTFRLPGDTGASVEGVWLDAVEFEYALRGARGDRALFWTQVGTRGHTLGGFTRQDVSLYDVTDPARPVELRGFVVAGSGSYQLSWSDTVGRAVTYYALTGPQILKPAAIVADQASELHSASNRADYVLIAPGELLDAVHPLVIQRQLQGLRVATVDVQDVYDEYSGGLLDPEAIRAFVADAYQHWAPPAPSYVLLVGDGHYDFMDHYGYGWPNVLPPYLGMVDPWWGETSADNRYAAVVGDDILPDVMLGRLPVSTQAEAEAVVNKIVAYERDPAYGDWNMRHVLIADLAEELNNFYWPLDEIYEAFIHDPWVGYKVYRDDLSEDAARQGIVDAWQRGALLMSYMGHSSWHQWGGEALLHVNDVSAFQNGQRLPVLLSMTCFTGYYLHPEYATLDEAFVRHPAGGAVASWSPSGLGLQSGHRRLLQGFYRAALQDSAVRIGSAAMAAKLDLHAQTGAYDELLDTYHLFGDPAMVLNKTFRPLPYSTYLPVLSGN